MNKVKEFYNKKRPSKGWSGVHLLQDNASSHKCEVVKSFLAFFIDNIYFDQMVDRIYPTELQLNRTNSSNTEEPFFDLNLCISNGTVSTKNL